MCLLRCVYTPQVEYWLKWGAQHGVDWHLDGCTDYAVTPLHLAAVLDDKGVMADTLTGEHRWQTQYSLEEHLGYGMQRTRTLRTAV